MKRKFLNYLVVIESDVRMGSKQRCYTAYCPLLGVSDSGDTVEEAMKNIQDLITFHLKMLRRERSFIPQEPVERSMVATVQVPYPGR